MLQLRYTLEPFIVGLVAQSISSKEVGQLRLTLMDMREALEAGDSEAGVSAYIAFHEELFTLTSNPTRTNPVKRGKWVLEQILGTPPPPPPPATGGTDDTASQPAVTA